MDSKTLLTHEEGTLTCPPAVQLQCQFRTQDNTDMDLVETVTGALEVGPEGCRFESTICQVTTDTV